MGPDVAPTQARWHSRLPGDGVNDSDEIPFANLGQRAFHGFAWILTATAAVKVITAAGQLIIASILIPADFGVVALAYSVTAFTTILQKNGLREILVRSRQFSGYCATAFFLSLLTGLVVAALTVLAAPVAAGIYHVPLLTYVLLVLAVSAPAFSLQSVPGAKLQRDLRFKTLALINVCEALATTGLTLLLAYFGAGPFAIVLPLPAVQISSFLVQLFVSGIPIRMNVDWPKMMELLRSSSFLLGAAAFYAFNMQGATIVLGLFRTVAIVGIFFFANNLVTQISGLVTNNLWTVLLPSLSKLQDNPQHQTSVFLRVTRIVNLVGMPICILTAVLAAPGLHLLYGQKWDAAIRVVQVISIGMCFNISFALSINLMMAQARYKELFWFNFYRAAGFILLVAVGAKLAGAIGAGVATAVFLLVYGPWITYIAIRPNGGSAGDVVSVHALPFLIALLSCAIPEGLAHATAAISEVPARHMIFVSALSVAGVVLSGRWLIPSAWEELATRFKTAIAK